MSQPSSGNTMEGQYMTMGLPQQNGQQYVRQCEGESRQAVGEVRRTGDAKTDESPGWTNRILCEYAGVCGVNADDFSLRELKHMARGRKSHHWDLISPLILYLANPWLPKNKKLGMKNVHPFFKEKAKEVKPFNRFTWLQLKSFIQKK